MKRALMSITAIGFMAGMTGCSDHDKTEVKVTEGGNIEGKDDIGQSPSWTAATTAKTMTLGFHGSKSVIFRGSEVRGQ